MIDFDKREHEMDQKVIDQFENFKWKETCPMCRIVEKFEAKLGEKETEKMFLTNFKEREHNQRTCFLDTVVFTNIGDGILQIQPNELHKLAIKRYETVLDFVTTKKKNTF